MITLQLLACVRMIIGFFLLLGLKPTEFTDAIFNRLLSKPKGIKNAINEATHRKKPSIFRREITEAQSVLGMTGRGSRFSMVCAVALFLFAVGAAVAAMLGNPFLVPVLAVGFLFLPFWYIKLSAHHYKKDISAELETAHWRCAANSAFCKCDAKLLNTPHIQLVRRSSADAGDDVTLH